MGLAPAPAPTFVPVRVTAERAGAVIAIVLGGGERPEVRDTNQVVFDATTTHERDGPAAFLAPFRGKLQADTYRGYGGLYQSGRVIEVGCWAHGRRPFVEAFLTDTSAALMIALIQQFYQVERDAADLDPAGRLALRQGQSVPLLAKIDAERQALALPCCRKSPVGDAVRYLTNQWTALQRFVEDGSLVRSWTLIDALPF